MMSEDDIRKWTDGRYTLMFDEHTFFVWDNEKEERMTALEVTKKLNEQQDIVIKQKEKVEGILNDYSRQFKRHSEEFSFMLDLAEDLGVERLEAKDD